MRRLFRFCPALSALLWATVLHAQPEPSFEATCAQLRDKLSTLGAQEEEWITIDVVGELRAVEHDGTLGYMLACEAPDPEVLCVTYEINDYEVGDSVVLSGTLNEIDADHVSLDPCLHYPADAERTSPLR
ncbi:hypothetical protein [uncultured Nitratireductor sp.]|uniref:hypothetical protein n=1 Tax=uncultured Nitratireductor sp. TaxID=520953 RepID=UPI0025DBDC5F|nr:hypothetical protein [uncultured Nitratireductor sp.]